MPNSGLKTELTTIKILKLPFHHDQSKGKEEMTKKEEIGVIEDKEEVEEIEEIEEIVETVVIEDQDRVMKGVREEEEVEEIEEIGEGEVEEEMTETDKETKGLLM